MKNRIVLFGLASLVLLCFLAAGGYLYF
ncbi:lysozyme, partial [Mesorhizobium sp. M7A.F.Ca.CA.004.02.1.1]